MITKAKKILWAINPFEVTGSILSEGDTLDPMQEKAARVVSFFQNRFQAEIIPVYVVGLGQWNISLEYTNTTASPWLQTYRESARIAFSELLSHFPEIKTEQPEVLVQTTASTSQAALILVNYAVEHGADLIVVSSHGRSGLKRLFLGSFAETLVLHAKIPVLVLGPAIPNESSVHAIERILFPTGFGLNSSNLFKRVVTLARNISAKITLFHAIPNPVEPVFQSGVYLLGGSWVPIHGYFGQDTDQKRRRASAWARWAENQGVSTELIIHTQIENIPEAIIKLANDTNSGLIAMDAESGPIVSALVGSITRHVMRHATCPVWVIRSSLANSAKINKDEIVSNKAAA